MGLDGPFELLGHSLGSYVAASYAAEHPARVSRLVLAAPVGLHDMKERISKLTPRSARPQTRAAAQMACALWRMQPLRQC
jgi:pimeloyl-ACP methyl ester carboxylesterase